MQALLPGYMRNIARQYFGMLFGCLVPYKSQKIVWQILFLDSLTAVEIGKGPKENLKAYLFRSAHNWIVDFYRKKSRLDIDLDDDFIDSICECGI